ncbi:MAG: hypothetical protein ACRELS_05750 [Candidatus Rokuibacteriota bacterium]
MHSARRQTGLRWTLLLACVLVFVGHVCAIPAADAHDDGDEAIHAASCDAVKLQSTPLVPVVVAAVRVEPWLPSIGDLPPSNREHPVLHRPPRFLLYASLLI